MAKEPTVKGESPSNYTQVLQSAQRLLAERDAIFAQVTGIYDRVKTFKLAQLAKLQVYVAKLGPLSLNFDDVQGKLRDLNIVLEKRDQVEINQVMNAFLDLVVDIEAHFLTLKKQEPSTPSAPAPTPQGASSTPFHPLERIRIPPFSGDIQQWPEFLSLFTSLVHQCMTISDVQKFQYLKSALSGEAASVISGIAITEDNYPVAFQALKARYSNPRRIASMYFSRLSGFKKMSSPSLASYKEFLNIHRNSVNALQAMALPDLADFLLFSLAIRNLDSVTVQKFEDRIATTGIPSFQQLMDFVVSQVQTLELQPLDHVNTRSPAPPKEFKAPTRRVFMVNSAGTRRNPLSGTSSKAFIPACSVCKAAHALTACPDFQSLSLAQKYEVARANGRCFNCLGSHMRQQCSSRNVCRLCGSDRHHSLLHADPAPTSNPQPVPKVQTSVAAAAPANPGTSGQACLFSATGPRLPQVLLGTLNARVLDSFGHPRTVRAVLDPGSQISVITRPCAEFLGLKSTLTRAQVTGVGNSPVAASGIAHFALHSRINGFQLPIQALVLPSIAALLPARPVPKSVLDRFAHLPLADPTLGTPSHVDLLLGADVFPLLLCANVPVDTSHGLSAISTHFGWVILGALNLNDPPSRVTSLHATCDLAGQLQRFWELEEIPSPRIANPDNDWVEQHFRETHTRNPDGRYVVALPFKRGYPPLAANAFSPRASLINLERKLHRHPAHHKEYEDFMKEYLHLQHMSFAISSSKYLIPHHVVTKGQNEARKIRVVFNASAKDLHSTSLNDCMLAGPKLQRDISTILLSFRLNAVALSADIEKMYRQVLVRQEDRCHQHIVWRPSPGSVIKEMELNTVTYGLTPSAFLAQRVLLQLVDDEGAAFPLASRALRECTYVDDVIAGAPDIATAQMLRQQLAELLLKGGFILKKWASSSPALLAKWQENPDCCAIPFDANEHAVPILGILWDPSTDVFRFSLSPFEGDITKRTLLCYIARVFDPLGYLAPITTTLKILLQQLWLARLPWDELLPVPLHASAATLVQQLPLITNFSIPRHIPHSASARRDIVGFCDASAQAYAASLYILFRDSNHVYPTLWVSKSRVAPLKVLTIPRLELCAAVLLSRLFTSLRSSEFMRSSSRPHLFSDSLDVLHWINTPPHLLNTFVANRVALIHELVPQAQWAHVPTAQNPSDLSTRAISPHNFMKADNQRLWRHGPEFLTSPLHEWPPPFVGSSSNCEPAEVSSSQCMVTASSPSNDLLCHIQRFASWVKLRRIFAWLNRFQVNSRRTPSERGSTLVPLSPSELEHAELAIIRLTQAHYFVELIRNLRTGVVVRSSLASLSPFLDRDGLVRVGGRLTNSSLQFHSKHPLLLPKQAHVSSLLCSHYHLTLLHSGPNTVLPSIRSRYWILSLRALLRQTIHRCLTCSRFRARSYQPLMAPLPEHRVSPARPFAHVGVDFAGPFSTRSSTLRSYAITKGYLCLFVCSATKALHLEFASELSTKCFLAALDRFVARRGLPICIYSDCGRNFVGAAKQLKTVQEFLAAASCAIAEHLSTRSITWRFNPPHAPHFGGLWEAGVKSVKGLLVRVIGDRPCTAEEYFTLFARIEAVLNSRPLVPVATDPNESAGYLTPGHFLIGAPLLALPETPLPDTSSLRNRWQVLQRVLQTFWRRWSREYLNTSIQRAKWNRPSALAAVDDVVMIKSSNCAPLSWPVGRILSLHPGPDQVSRVASVRTSDGVVTRPVRNLIPLPVEE